MVLEKIAENVNNNPKATIGVVLFITFLMVAQLALNPQDGTISQSSFLPDNEVISALNDIGDKFSTEYPVDTLIYRNQKSKRHQYSKFHKIKRIYIIAIRK